jgi:hypothetical protein
VKDPTAKINCILPQLTFTTGLGAFAESRNPLGEGLYPHGGAFTERMLLAKASQWSPAGEGPFRREPRVTLSVHVRREATIVLGEAYF